MNFECAELLGLSHVFQLWGDIANFRDVQTISIRGRIRGQNGLESVEPIWSGLNPFFSFTGYEPILINGYSLGTGRLVSINFDESTDTISKPYQATLEILQTGNLWNFTGRYYQGFYGSDSLSSNGSAFGPQDDYNTKYLNSFSENFNFSTQKSGEFRYDRSISMDIDASYTGSAILFFESVTDKLFSQSNDLQIINAFYPDYYSGISNSAISYRTESYDNINRRYSASQTFTFDQSAPWTWNYRHTLNHSKEGYITVSENGDIKSTRKSGTNYMAYANSGYNFVETGIFSRVSGFYNYYVTGSPNNIYSGICDPLISYPTSSSLARNTIVGTISYTKTYTDNPAQKSGYTFSYQNDISKEPGGIVSVSENGQYKGLFSDRVSGFNYVLNAYQTGISDIYSRVSGFYTGSLNSLYECASGYALNVARTDETYREYFQEVGYSYQFTDDRSIVNDANFYRISATYSDQKPVQQVGYFNLLNDSEIAQRESQSTLGVFSNRISIIGRDSTSVNSYLSGAYTKVVKPTGSEVFLSDFSYSLTKANNQFDLNATYNYSNYSGVENILV